jgi:PAS domain S-box-containing protein
VIEGARKNRILVIDDGSASSSSSAIAERLTSLGVEVLPASSGEEALDRVAGQEVDCVLVRLASGGPAVLETCERIRLHPELGHVPLIVCSSGSMGPALGETIDAGADDCIPEEDVELLFTRLRAQLRRKANEDEGRRVREQKLLVETETRAERALEAVRAELLERRLEVEARLRASEARARAIVETAGDGIVTSDVAGRIVSFNPAAERLFGYRADDVIGRDVGVLAGTPGEAERHAEHVSGFADGWGPGPFGMSRRLTGRHKDGSVVPMDVVLSDVVLEDGARTFVAVIHDMTQQQRSEEAMARARQQAEQASEAKSSFLAQMSHEIRTPMNAILGFAQLLATSEDLQPHLRAHVEIINTSGEHLMTLINDVLEMSRIESGRVQLNEGVFDLAELVNGLEGMFQVRVRGAGLTLLVELERPLPRGVRGDAGKLRQILVNLLGNAAKFTHSGRIVLGAGFVDVASARIVLRVEVTDTGVGIASDELEAIFEPFYQASGGDHRGGTGLGLGISRRFAQLMGGDLRVTSEPGVGSTFTLEVPLALARTVDEPHPGRVIGLAPGQRTVRVLVLDDVETNLELVCAFLRPLGFEVHVARDGREGLELAKSLRPDVVLVDARMPVLDGEAVIRAIRAWGEDRPRLVAVTAAAFEEDKERLMSCGADDFVRKPFRSGRLLDAIGRVAGVRYAYADSSDAAPGGMTLTADSIASAFSLKDAHALRCKVELGDMEQALEILDGAHASAPAVVDALRDALEAFDYALVLSVLPSRRPEPAPAS